MLGRVGEHGTEERGRPMGDVGRGRGMARIYPRGVRVGGQWLRPQVGEQEAAVIMGRVAGRTGCGDRPVAARVVTVLPLGVIMLPMDERTMVQTRGVVHQQQVERPGGRGNHQPEGGQVGGQTSARSSHGRRVPRGVTSIKQNPVPGAAEAGAAGTRECTVPTRGIP